MVDRIRQAVAVHVPTVLAGIVMGYMESPFVRPFADQKCVFCRVGHRRYNENTCNKHSQYCPFCFGPIPKYKPDHINYCKGCRSKYPWLARVCIQGHDLWERLYATREEVDMARFRIRVDMMCIRQDMIRQELEFSTQRVKAYDDMGRPLTQEESIDREKYRQIMERAIRDNGMFYVNICRVFPTARELQVNGNRPMPYLY